MHGIIMVGGQIKFWYIIIWISAVFLTNVRSLVIVAVLMVFYLLAFVLRCALEACFVSNLPTVKLPACNDSHIVVIKQ